MTNTYQIAQFIVPNDGLGPPNFSAAGGHYVDWANGRCFLWGAKSVRAYSTTFQTQYPYAAIASPFFTGTRGNQQTSIEAFGLTADGYPLAACAATSYIHAPIFKFDPNTLENLGQFGVGGNPPLYGSYPLGLIQLINSVGKALASISVNGVPFTLCQEINFGHGGIFRTDTMAAAGFYQIISTMTAASNAFICGGQSGGSTGTFYCLDAIISASPTAATSITLRKITVQSGAETWTISQWPTQNPYISLSSILTLNATDVDATWTNILARSVGYDTHNDIVIAFVAQFTGGNAEYLVGIDPSGTVLWKQKVPAVPHPDTWPDFTQTRDALGYVTLIGNGDSAFVVQYHTLDGTPTPYSLIGGLGGEVRLSTTDDVTGGWIGCVTYNSAISGAPTALSGTPSTFTAGHAMIRPVLITPVTLSFSNLQVVEHPRSVDRNLRLRYSGDGGYTWSDARNQDIGDTGEYQRSIIFQRLGQHRRFVAELSWSSAYFTALNGAWVVATAAKS